MESYFVSVYVWKAMIKRLMSSPLPSFLQRWVDWLFSDPTTNRFLRERNARLTLQVAESHSFYVVKVTPKTTFAVPSDKFQLQVKLQSNQTLHVTVFSQTKRQTLVDITVPVDSSGGAMHLNLGEIHLKIEIDTDPSAKDMA